MRTEKQIAASRANGPKSKGPRALRPAPDHPGHAHPEQSQPHYERRHLDLANIIVHPHESRRAFLAFCIHLDEQFQPENAFDQMVVGRIAAAHWRQLRYWRQERDAARAAAAQSVSTQSAAAQSENAQPITHSAHQRAQSEQQFAPHADSAVQSETLNPAPVPPQNPLHKTSQPGTPQP